jgi:hypothetical protein
LWVGGWEQVTKHVSLVPQAANSFRTKQKATLSLYRE